MKDLKLIINDLLYVRDYSAKASTFLRAIETLRDRYNFAHMYLDAPKDIVKKYIMFELSYDSNVMSFPIAEYDKVQQKLPKKKKEMADALIEKAKNNDKDLEEIFLWIYKENLYKDVEHLKILIKKEKEDLIKYEDKSATQLISGLKEE